MTVPPTTRPNAPPTTRTAAPTAHPPPQAGLAFARVLGRTRGKAVAVATRGAPPGPKAQLPVAAVSHEPRRDHARVEPKGEEKEEVGHGRRHGHAHGDEMLDPVARQAAILAGPQQVPVMSAPEAAPGPRARMSLEELLPQLVRRIAWAGDKNKASVRMEIGAGAYAGATLLVHADAGRVRVEVSGVSGDELRARIDQRLRRHGLDVESVT